jgi:hypothetical protein
MLRQNIQDLSASQFYEVKFARTPANMSNEAGRTLILSRSRK